MRSLDEGLVLLEVETLPDEFLLRPFLLELLPAVVVLLRLFTVLLELFVRAPFLDITRESVLRTPLLPLLTPRRRSVVTPALRGLLPLLPATPFLPPVGLRGVW